MPPPPMVKQGRKHRFVHEIEGFVTPRRATLIGTVRTSLELILGLPRTPEKGERQEFGAGIMDCVAGDNFRLPLVKLLVK